MADVIAKVEHAAEDVAKVFHEAEVKVSEVFVALVGKDQAHAFAQAAAKVLKSEAGKLAIDAVKAFEAVVPVLSGAAKHDQAASKLSSDLKAAGHDIPASLVNLLIEAAVAAIKGYIILP